MKKKLDTRFPASRIKKIMQADEDVGKIAMAVPLLVSKALELFLQDLCDKTYDITLKKGAKTVNSLHLKQCVQSTKLFDFLKDTVGKVPDLGGGSDATLDDKSATKKRKISEDEDGNKEESKRAITSHISSNGRGRGRGRGRGKRAIEKFEDVVDDSYPYQSNENQEQDPVVRPDNILCPADLRATSELQPDKLVRNFDLNVDPIEDVDSSLKLGGDLGDSLSRQDPEKKQYGDIHGWTLEEMERMAVDPGQLANLNAGADEEYEDYDEEDEEE